MNLENFLLENVQLVEIYICPKHVALDTKMEIGWSSHSKKPNVPFSSGNTTTFKEYHHRDMCYSYDMSNDAQRVVRKTLQKEGIHKNLYIVSYTEEILPVHRFPCVKEITYEVEIKRTTYRINNRMYLVVDYDGEYEYYYIRYQHAQNVDVKQMQEDLSKCMRKIFRDS